MKEGHMYELKVLHSNILRNAMNMGCESDLRQSATTYGVKLRLTGFEPRD